MSFKLVSCGWDRVLDNVLQADHSCISVICPFIKERTVSRLLKYGRPRHFRVITRFDLDGFLAGASDIAAIRELYKAGAKIRGVRNLHAKAYLIGKSAIVTSANLTEKGLRHNHEFGFVTNDGSIVAECEAYFENLWKLARIDLQSSRIDEWDAKVSTHLASGAWSRPSEKLGDEGIDVGFSQDGTDPLNWVTTAEQGFVKFLGEGHKRKEHSFSVLEEVKRAGCHWALGYPITKRPRSVRDGAIMFMGRLVKEPNDTLIFGRAIGMKYIEGRDDATDADIAFPDREWKEKMASLYPCS